MVGKRVQLEDDIWAAINLLRQERRRSFQQLATEAFSDLLTKHGSAVGLKAQLKKSLPDTPLPRTRRKKSDAPAVG